MAEAKKKTTSRKRQVKKPLPLDPAIMSTESAPSSADKILEAKDLRISFRTNNGTVKAVRGVSFSLYRGRTLGIVGESGSGKSVTSRAILGILAGNKIIEGGQILYDGRDLLSLREESFTKIRGSKISMIFQDPMSSLNPIMRVGKQLTEAMILKGKTARKEAVSTIKVITKIINEHAIKEQLATPEELKHLFERLKGDAFTTIDYINDSDKPLVKELYMLCFNEDYSRERSISEEDKKVLLECLVPSEADLLRQDDSDRRALRRKQRMIKEAKARRERVVRDIERNVIVPEILLTEDETKRILELLALAVDREYHHALEHKKETLAFTEKLLADDLSSAETYQPAHIMAQLHELSRLIKHSQYRLAEMKDDVALTFVLTLRDYIREYRRAQKILAQKIKSDAKKADRAAHGKNTDQTVKQRAYAREAIVTPDEVFAKTIDLVKKFVAHYQSIIDSDDFVASTYAERLFVYLKERFGESQHRVTPRDAKERAIELLGEVGIPEPEKRFRQYPFQFSGGMRQRIVIAIALSSNPDILICDEPTTALDVTIQSQILELINKLKVEKGLSIIFITHDLGVIANMADDIAVMYAGKIVEYGGVDEIFYDPRHPYTWALLASMPDLNTKEKLEAIPGTPPNMILPPKGDAFAARNKYALKIDFEEEPPFFKVSDTHFAATWLLHPQAPKVVPPKIVTERIRVAKERQKERGE